MKKNKLFGEIIIFLLPVISLLSLIFVYKYLPNRVPISLDFKGNVDGFSSNKAILFALPILSFILYAYFMIMPRIDIQRENYKRFAKPYWIMRISWMFVMLVLNILYILQTFYPNKILIISAGKAMIALGILLFGDKLPKIKKNHFIGVVNPWTLRSDIVWQKTQRFTGKFMFGCALLMFVLAFINQVWSNALFISLIALIIVLPNVYSINNFYVKNQNR